MVILTRFTRKLRLSYKNTGEHSAKNSMLNHAGEWRITASWYNHGMITWQVVKITMGFSIGDWIFTVYTSYEGRVENRKKRSLNYFVILFLLVFN